MRSIIVRDYRYRVFEDRFIDAALRQIGQKNIWNKSPAITAIFSPHLFKEDIVAENKLIGVSQLNEMSDGIGSLLHPLALFPLSGR